VPQHVLGGRLQRLRDFWARVVQKSAEDNIFFLAGAIAFNVLVAVVPLLLLTIGLWGFLVKARYGEPAQVITPLLQDFIPPSAGGVDLARDLGGVLDRLVDERAGFSLIGALLFLWLSTRLVGTLRAALREVFDIAQDRGIVGGKIFDIQMVVVGGALILVNVALTIILRSVGNWWAQVLGVGVGDQVLGAAEALLGYVAAFASVWVLFVLVYRYLPAQRLPRRTVFIAATVMAVTFEAMKLGFGWYATEVAVYRTTYGNLATLVLLFFWIYYGSVVFILSGEIAQVSTMRAARRAHLARALNERRSADGEQGAKAG